MADNMLPGFEPPPLAPFQGGGSPRPQSGAQADKRLSGHRERILARLKLGPATNVDLNSVCYRFSARILELRKLGFVIHTECVSPGVYRYELKGGNG